MFQYEKFSRKINILLYRYKTNSLKKEGKKEADRDRGQLRQRNIETEDNRDRQQ